jgi:transposase
MDRDDLEKLSKGELVELVLKLQRPAKTSRTSSKPPSTDKKAKRENSKPGGAKPGHEGHHRRLAADPDRIVDHRPERCPGCGGAIAPDTPGTVIGEYDRIDIPPISPEVERHRRLSCACPGCGASVKAPVPAVACGSPFGPNIASLAFYLRYVQHVSYQRLEALFSDVFGLTISQGALGNLFRRGGERFKAGKLDILARLRKAEAVASDETGVRIEGETAQQWVFRTPGLVLHEMAFSRGAKVVRAVMGGHRPTFWTSDRYSAQQGHGGRHQTCLAHLARDVARVLDVGCERTGLALKLWIKDAFALAGGLGDLAVSTIARKSRDLDDRIGRIVAQQTGCEETDRVLRKIANARDQLLTFATAPPGLVEPTNNACERALRPAVVGRKITNGFRAEWAAHIDAAVRSVVDTARLEGATRFSTIRQTLAA